MIIFIHSIMNTTRYDIKLTPDLEAFTFSGEETVELNTSSELGESCKEIKMHAKELCFISASFKVIKTKGEKVEAAAVNAEEVSLTLNKLVEIIVSRCFNICTLIDILFLLKSKHFSRDHEMKLIIRRPQNIIRQFCHHFK